MEFSFTLLFVGSLIGCFIVYLCDIWAKSVTNPIVDALIASICAVDAYDDAQDAPDDEDVMHMAAPKKPDLYVGIRKEED